MINRVLIRTKIVQILYAYFKADGKSLPVAEKELFHSIEKSYDLYFHLLLLAIRITDYAAQKIDANRHKLKPSKEDLNPNTRFIDNSFVSQLARNEQFKTYIAKHKLSWADYPDVIKDLFNQISESDFYVEYMSSRIHTYEADKNIWRKIYEKIIYTNDELENALEEQSIYWLDDMETVVSFIVKTIKYFDKAQGDTQKLQPMFRNEADLDFASKLLTSVITNNAYYRALIDTYTMNWDLDRIAFMDFVIMEIALAEIMNCPTIPVSVSMNEYIEISKYYSTDKSATFINGVLDKIVNNLKKENKLIKVVDFNIKN